MEAAVAAAVVARKVRRFMRRPPGESILLRRKLSGEHYTQGRAMKVIPEKLAPYAGDAQLFDSGEQPRATKARYVPLRHEAYRRCHFDATTCKLFVTEKIPETPLARIPAMFLSPSLSTTPSRLTWPFFTMIRIGFCTPRAYR